MAAGSQADPCVVLQHGFTVVKEMHLDRYAEEFRSVGVSCLVYDHPGAWQQVCGLQEAITHASVRADVGERLIGVWGSSHGAGNAYVTTAIDQRVVAVAGQVPFISGLARSSRWPARVSTCWIDRHLARPRAIGANIGVSPPGVRRPSVTPSPPRMTSAADDLSRG